jgi:hypothetical protein
MGIQPPAYRGPSSRSGSAPYGSAFSPTKNSTPNFGSYHIGGLSAFGLIAEPLLT